MLANVPQIAEEIAETVPIVEGLSSHGSARGADLGLCTDQPLRLFLVWKSAFCIAHKRRAAFGSSGRSGARPARAPGRRFHRPLRIRRAPPYLSIFTGGSLLRSVWLRRKFQWSYRGERARVCRAMFDRATDGPKTMKDERQRQIAELEAKRDSQLRRAHHMFSAQRWLWPFLSLLMTPLFLCWLFEFLARLREVLSALPSGWPDCILLIPSLGGTALLGFMAAVSGMTTWIMWISPRPAPDDLWGYSDLVGYEDDESPREIQARIDALRAQSKDETESH